MKATSIDAASASGLARCCAALPIALLFVFLAACAPSKPQFDAIDITGAEYARNFALTDPAGKPRALADFKGKAVVVFFGFTHCMDVCPTTLSELASAMKALGGDSDRVQVLFVTVDPERDTPAVLAEYAPNFDRRFIGLYGDADATAKVAKEFKVFYQKVPGSTPDSYAVDHTANSYVFDPQGRIRLVLRPGQPAASIVHDLKLLLS